MPPPIRAHPFVKQKSMEYCLRYCVEWCETKGVDILCCPEAVLGGLADDANALSTSNRWKCCSLSCEQVRDRDRRVHRNCRRRKAIQYRLFSRRKGRWHVRMICNDFNYPELPAAMIARGAPRSSSCNSLPPERANVVALSRAVDITRVRNNEVMIVRVQRGTLWVNGEVIQFGSPDGH